MALVQGWDGIIYDDGTITQTASAAPTSYDNPYFRWSGQAGTMPQFMGSNGQWINSQQVEHPESAGYIQTALQDPQVMRLFELNATHPELLNNEQKAFIHNPTVGLDSLGQNSRWGGTGNLFDNIFDPQQAGALMLTGGTSYLSPADISSGGSFIQSESPAAQSARDDSGGVLDNPLMIAALIGAGVFLGPEIWAAMAPETVAAVGSTVGPAGMIGSGMSAGQLSLLGANVGYGTALSGTAGALAGTVGANMLSGSNWADILQGGSQIDTLSNAGSAYNPATASLDQIINAVSASGGNAAAVSELTPELAAAAASGTTISSLSPSLLAQAAQWLSNTTGTEITGSQLLSGGANVLSGILSGAGGLLSGSAARDAAQTSANAQLEAARIAADAAKFRPVGVTTRFGQSQFTKDANGNVIGAGYTLSPDIKAQQDRLMGVSNNMLTQYENAQNTFAPMGVAGQRAMALGNQYLSADPQAQALKYMQDQQALLATGRERDTNQMLTGEFNRGTYGLGVGATTTGMGAANPRLEALYNAQRQQDLGLAAQATQGGMDYAKFGAGMVGVGGDLTKGMFTGQTAAYAPYQTALQGAGYLEGLGQNAMDLGVNMGKTMSNAQSGQLLAQGMTNAAQTMQPANAYSPWGALLSGAGNQVQNYQNTQAQQAQQLQQLQFQNAMLTALGGKGL